MKLPSTLNYAYQNDRLAHAYLFYGLPVNQYRSAIIDFFRTIGCQQKEKFCSECADCKQIESLTHPDLVAFEGQSDKITVSDVREKIVQPASLTSVRSERLLFWLNDIQRMTPAASNALLKVLEEPPGEAIFVLTARSRWECLPTIRSRCQWIRFAPQTDIPSTPEEALEHFWPGLDSGKNQIKKWKKLLAGKIPSDELTWSREKARQFLSFLLALVHQCYTNSEADDDLINIAQKRNLTYKNVPQILSRFSELERGAKPLLIINSLLEEIYYPEEQQEWLNVI